MHIKSPYPGEYIDTPESSNIVYDKIINFGKAVKVSSQQKKIMLLLPGIEDLGDFSSQVVMAGLWLNNLNIIIDFFYTNLYDFKSFYEWFLRDVDMILYIGKDNIKDERSFDLYFEYWMKIAIQTTKDHPTYMTSRQIEEIGRGNYDYFFPYQSMEKAKAEMKKYFLSFRLKKTEKLSSGIKIFLYER
jgi:hypothetical protein